MIAPGLRRLGVSAVLVARDLARNRVAVGLLVVIPVVLYLLLYATTGDRPIDFALSGLDGEWLTRSERDLSMLFIGMAAVSGVSAFLAFVLVLRPAGPDRRLAFEGYRPFELLLAKMLVLLGVALLVGVYVTLLLPLFARPSRLVGVFLGFLLTSLQYGVVGMIVGALARRELEGILFILLLVNVDAGWLQNPVFYAHAHNQALIRALPGHLPGQVAMLAAFSDGPLLTAVLRALAYTVIAAAVAALAYRWRIRVER